MKQTAKRVRHSEIVARREQEYLPGRIYVSLERAHTAAQ